MKQLLSFVCLVILLASCKKDRDCGPQDCDLQKAYIDNAAKVNITNGVWGTVSFIEGNCMPVIDPSVCKHCPVIRKLRIYQYTLRSQATASGNSPVFFDSFNSQLIREITTDAQGFFQADIPAGTYSMAVVEDGKLYANGGDGAGGIHPFTFTTGTTVKANFTLSYKAVF